VIGPHQVVIGLSAGFVLILLGLVPGLFQGLVEGVRNFSDALCSRFPSPSCSYARIYQPRWLGLLGAALIAATLLAYSAH
jgi:hypothetical protein